MKTKLFLLSALAIFALAGCNKDERPGANDEVETGAPATLEINLGTSVTSKAAPDVVTETAIKKGVIFVFKGTGANPALDAKHEFDFTGSNVTPITVNITQGIRQVYVVANIVPADFANVYTLSDILNISNKLSLDGFRTSGSLPMSGFVNNVNTVGSTIDARITIPVTLNFIGSRVHVDWEITTPSAPAGLVITGVALLNADAKSEYFATLNGAIYNPLTHGMLDYLRGISDISTFTGSYLPSNGISGTTNNYDAGLWIPTADKGFTNNHTYVFENSSPKPIIVAFEGTYGGKTYYWPVVINGALNGIGGSNAGDQSASVKRGMIYYVKAAIKGLGVEDPYGPINKGAIDVVITPATWAPVVYIDQEFN